MDRKKRPKRGAPKDTSVVHAAIKAAIIANPTAPARVICEKIGCTPAQITNYKQKHGLKDIVEEVLEPARIIQAARNKAAQCIVDLLDDEQSHIRLNAARDILGEVLKEKTQPATKHQHQILVAEIRKLGDDELKQAVASQLQSFLANSSE